MLEKILNEVNINDLELMLTYINNESWLQDDIKQKKELQKSEEEALKYLEIMAIMGQDEENFLTENIDENSTETIDENSTEDLNEKLVENKSEGLIENTEEDLTKTESKDKNFKKNTNENLAENINKDLTEELNKNETEDIEKSFKENTSKDLEKDVSNLKENINTEEEKKDYKKEQVTDESNREFKYSNMDDAALYSEIRNFLIEKGVKKAPVSRDIVEEEFGKSNVLRLIKRSYLVCIGEKITVGIGEGI